MDPLLLLLGIGAIVAYAASQGQKIAQSPFAVGQTAYLGTATTMTVYGQAVTLQAGTRVYVQTSDASGNTMIRTDSGNVGTVPTSSIVASLPAGVQMQVN